MLHLVAAVVLLIHGAIHLIGFVVPWQLAVIDGFPYRTRILGDVLDVGDAGARTVGVLWLACALGFVIAGLALWRGEPWAIPLAAALALASLVVCVLGLPEAATGIVVDVAILGVAAYLLVTGTAAGLATR